MKKIIVSLMVAITTVYSTAVIAQQDPVSKLFGRYAGKEGFTSVYVTGDMLKMASNCDPENQDLSFLSRLTEVRVLAQECAEGQSSELNFHAEIWPNLDHTAYKELLIVKEKDQDVKIVARENGDVITEFLIIVSGSDENVLVQIKGSINLNELDKLSDSFDIEGFDQLKKLEEAKN
ncbi:MAG: DUF4252 domain-containing protein [Bacteroidales bacterium]|nr:DUF4252 domain-containing protein [Bacteroidales bacterium]